MTSAALALSDAAAVSYLMLANPLRTPCAPAGGAAGRAAMTTVIPALYKGRVQKPWRSGEGATDKITLSLTGLWPRTAVVRADPVAVEGLSLSPVQPLLGCGPGVDACPDPCSGRFDLYSGATLAWN